MDEPIEGDGQHIRQRVVYAAMALPVRLGLMFGLSMREMVDLLQMAAFHETRRRGLKMREVAGLLDISMRKVSQLSQRLRRNFLDAEVVVELPRRIEFMLWAEPLSEARIRQVVREDDASLVDEALEQLMREGRVRRHLDETEAWIYEVPRSEFRLVSEYWLARLDGLGNLLANVANAVDARFFDNDPRAFARTLSLRVRRDDMLRLHQLYNESLYETLRQLDARARDDDAAVTIDLSIVWAPYEHLRNKALPVRSESE